MKLSAVQIHVWFVPFKGDGIFTEDDACSIVINDTAHLRVTFMIRFMMTKTDTVREVRTSIGKCCIILTNSMKQSPS
jgi:hypothetical protein